MLTKTTPLLATVRAGFVLQGMTLRKWCLLNGIDPGYGHKVMAGKFNGPAAIRLRERIITASAKKPGRG